MSKRKSSATKPRTKQGTKRGEGAPAAEPRDERPGADALPANEIGAEPAADEGPAEPPADEDTAARIANLESRLLRALAETENVRRRGAKERDEVGKYAITAFARDLLPVIDNLRRAIESTSDEARKDKGLVGVVEGVEMTERELVSVLDRHGIRRIDPLGEKFDHNFHQAIFEVDDCDEPAGTVVQVVQAGYVLADRLLRPAMVGVAKGPKPTTGVDTEA